MRSAIHFVPIATTVLALGFSVVLFRRYRERGGLHHLWWAVGALSYAAGTITESVTTLTGWHEGVFRAWYITGALLGGAPLAQGSVYLHFGRRTANALSMVLIATIVIASVCVLMSPIRYDLVEQYRLSGNVLEWSWVRRFSPFINIYAVLGLVGLAIRSAAYYAVRKETWHRCIGNVYIAIGGVLPGIGGTFTRFGHVEVLYVTEFLGLGLIIIGYYCVIAQPGATVFPVLWRAPAPPDPMRYPDAGQTR
jgi:hypothetical protein